MGNFSQSLKKAKKNGMQLIEESKSISSKSVNTHTWHCPLSWLAAICTFLAICGCTTDDEGLITKPIITSGERRPAFSPSGEYIAYTRESENEICLYEIATEESEYITTGSLPGWSPYGEWIVYVKDRDIHKINVETGEIYRLTTWGSCFFPDWASNGLLLAFDCTIGNPDSNGIWIMDSVGGSTRHLGLGREPKWNPECNKLTYTGKSANPSHHAYDVWITDTSGTDTLRLTDGGGQSPVFSPDGSKIAYVGLHRDENNWVFYNIWIMENNGVNKTQLTFEPTDDNWSGAYDPSWSPDGSQLVYARMEVLENKYEIEHIWHLWVMDANGVECHMLSTQF